MTQPSLSQEENLFDFFRCIENAIDSSGTMVSEDECTTFNLLVERGRSSRCPSPKRLWNSESKRRNRVVWPPQSWREREIGRVYVRFFGQAQRKNVSLDYYLSMWLLRMQLATVMRWTGSVGGSRIYTKNWHISSMHAPPSCSAFEIRFVPTRMRTF